jgi:nucleotide exchange factor SIL1
MLAIFLGIIALFAQPSLASSPQQSPTADTQDVICHTDNPADCYPRIFQPTDEFQTVHDDQEIPNGLHVRMNIWTGVKEAKINVPDEHDPALEGLPVDSAVVVVEQEGVEGGDELRVPKGAPVYEPVGQIKSPPVEEIGFWDALKAVKAGGQGADDDFRGALRNLLEMSNDIYYGLKITEDAEVVQNLMCLMAGADAPSVATPADRQAAARILAGAMQNNVKALEKVEGQWEALMGSTCGASDAKLRDAFYAGFMPAAASAIPAEELPRAASRVGSTVFAVKGLLQSPAIRDDFLASRGMGKLTEVLAAGDDEAWAPAQRKVGHLLLDTFLDAEAGAAIGVWPKGPALGDGECEAAAGRGDEGCLDFYVKRIASRNKGEQGHWSAEVHDKLRASRIGSRNEKGEL